MKRPQRGEIATRKKEIKAKMVHHMLLAIGKQPDALPQLREIAQRVLVKIGGMDKIAKVYAECLDSTDISAHSRLRLLEMFMRMLTMCYEKDPPKDDLGLMDEEELVARHRQYARMVAAKVMNSIDDETIESGTVDYLAEEDHDDPAVEGRSADDGSDVGRRDPGDAARKVSPGKPRATPSKHRSSEPVPTDAGTGTVPQVPGT